jgi:hypothetical protein
VDNQEPNNQVAIRNKQRWYFISKQVLFVFIYPVRYIGPLQLLIGAIRKLQASQGFFKVYLVVVIPEVQVHHCFCLRGSIIEHNVPGHHAYYQRNILNNGLGKPVGYEEVKSDPLFNLKRCFVQFPGNAVSFFKTYAWIFGVVIKQLVGYFIYVFRLSVIEGVFPLLMYTQHLLLSDFDAAASLSLNKSISEPCSRLLRNIAVVDVEKIKTVVRCQLGFSPCWDQAATGNPKEEINTSNRERIISGCLLIIPFA